MRFAFEEHQLEFRDQVRSFADKECAPDQVRATWDAPEDVPAWSARRWQMLAEMGVIGLTVPEASGGLGLGMVDAVLPLEEMGRGAVPEPVLATTVLAVPLLAQVAGLGSDSPSRATKAGELLAGVVAGEVVVAVGQPGVATVPDAVGADVLLLEHEAEIHAVPRAQATLTPRGSIDGLRGLAEIEWTPGPDTLLVPVGDAEGVLAALRRRAAMGTGAMLVGVARQLVTMTAAYATQRRQFGKPIGSFQAVKHHLADALVRIEFAAPLVYRAAWSIDEGDPQADAHASMAKASASDAGDLAARTALQVHGAIGYTWEHDVHMWMKRAWSLAAAWGDAAEHRANVLRSMTAP
jgi:alkylation response protein AidB-like acyl-CoA dehydrogenase